MMRTYFAETEGGLAIISNGFVQAKLEVFPILVIVAMEGHFQRQFGAVGGPVEPLS